MTTWRQVSPAASTRALKPSDSARPSQTARKASSKRSRTSLARAASPEPQRLRVGAQAEVEDVQRAAVGAGHLVGALVGDLDAEVREEGQHLGQRQVGAAVELEAPLARVVGRGVVVEVQPGRAVALAERVDAVEVVDRRRDVEVLLVRLGQGLRVGRHRPRRSLEAPCLAERLGEVLVPGAGRVDDALLEGRLVHVGDVGARRHTHDEVQAGERGLADARRVVDVLAAEGLEQDGLDAQPDRRVVAVAREVDEARDEAAELVAAQEELGLAALLQVQHARRDLGELRRARLEELVARVGLEDLEDVLARVAVGAEAGQAEHLLGAHVEQRDVVDRVVVGRRGVEAEEALLAHALAAGVEALDRDVVEVDVAVDRRARVGLGDDEDGGVASGPAGSRREHESLSGRRPVVAQQAEPGAGDLPRDVLAVLVREGVLAVAEEGEVVVGEPLEEAARLARLVGVGAGRRRRTQLARDGERVGTHLGPVLDGVADVLEHVAQRGPRRRAARRPAAGRSRGASRTRGRGPPSSTGPWWTRR